MINARSHCILSVNYGIIYIFMQSEAKLRDEMPNSSILSGSHFCPSSAKSQVIVEIYYSDLSYRVINEEVVYPLKEMVNEWTGILGLYFGFSFLTVAAMIKGTVIAFKQKAQIQENIAKKVSTWRSSDTMNKKRTCADVETTKYVRTQMCLV